MSSISELYLYYCHRCGCRPNSRLLHVFAEAESQYGDAHTLHTLDVSDNYLGKKGVVPLFDVLKRVATLTRLDVRNNMLEADQLRHLVDCLSSHPCITTVDVRNNCLGDDSAGLLTRLLECNRHITELLLAGNDLRPSTLQQVTRLLEANRQQQAQPAVAKPTSALPATTTTTTTTATATTARRVSCYAEVHGELAEHESGGHHHFNTWWQNPQYVLRVGRASRVAVTMRVTPNESVSRQCGFVVMRGDGVRRVIRLEQDTVVAESAMDARYCTVEVTLEAHTGYVVMPYTFRPRRTMSYLLCANVIDLTSAPCVDALDAARRTATATRRTSATSPPQCSACSVSLERIDARYDWCIYTMTSSWTLHNAGGALQLHTWRHNDMYHICCDYNSNSSVDNDNDANGSNDKNKDGDGDDKAAAAPAAAIAATTTCTKTALVSSSSSLTRPMTPMTVCALLSTHVDPDEARGRCIGVHFVEADGVSAARPPLPTTATAVVAAASSGGYVCGATAFARYTTTTPTALDCFVVPSTATPGQTGEYTLTLFSSTPLRVTRSVAPHGWHHRVVRGHWRENSCGGCVTRDRAWMHNPAVHVLMANAAASAASAAAAAAGGGATGDAVASDTTPAVCLHAFLQLHDDNNVDQARQQIQQPPPWQEEEEDAEAQQERHNDDDGDDKHRVSEDTNHALHCAFVARHRTEALECCVAVVEAASHGRVTSLPPPPSLLSPFAAAGEEACVSVSGTMCARAFYLVPMLRYAGQRAGYTLHVYASQPFVLSSNGDDDTLLACSAAVSTTADTTSTVGGTTAAAAASSSPAVTANGTTAATTKRGNTAAWSVLTPPTATLDGADLHVSTATEEAAATRAAAVLCPWRAVDAALSAQRTVIARQCTNAHGRFSDRDFPRGASSLWLAAREAAAPARFPRTFGWRRASRLRCVRGTDKDDESDDDDAAWCIARDDDGGTDSYATRSGVARVRCLVRGQLTPPCQYGERHVFASALQAVAAKASWLHRLWVCYDVARGVAQFRFYKNEAWVGVTVDDYVVVDAAGALCMGGCVCGDDVFYALAEKAYAKLHRCYEALEQRVAPDMTLMQQLVQTLTDCSGGYTTVHALRSRTRRRIATTATTTTSVATTAATATTTTTTTTMADVPADNACGVRGTRDDDVTAEDDKSHDNNNNNKKEKECGGGGMGVIAVTHAHDCYTTNTQPTTQTPSLPPSSSSLLLSHTCARREALWRVLQRTTQPHVLVSFVLYSEHVDTATALGDRTRAGLLPDRLYGVVRVGAVANERFVQLRNWREGAATRWGGKWAAHSSHWTPTLRRALHVHTTPASPATRASGGDANDDDDDDTLWMSLDEVLYYFTDMLVTEWSPSVARVTHTGAAVLRPREEDNAQRDCPQFLVTVTTAAAAAAAAASEQADDETVLQLHVGVHQPDARMTITREQGATARYRSALGVALFAPTYSSNNDKSSSDRSEEAACSEPRRCERLEHVDASRALCLAAPARTRDVFVSLTLPMHTMPLQQQQQQQQQHHQQWLSPSSSSSRTLVQRFVAVPLTESTLRDKDVPYTVTARCTSSRSDVLAQTTVSLALLTQHTTYAVEGAWTSATAGGGPRCAQWRHNPQFHLELSTEAQVVLQLLRRDDGGSSSSSSSTNDSGDDDDADACMGFTVHATSSCNRLLCYEAATVCAAATAPSAGCGLVAATLTLSGVARRCGVPYTVVVHCTRPGACGAFTLQVLSSVPVQLRRIDARVDWHQRQCHVQLRNAAGNAGGGVAAPSWRCSPQLALTFPVAREGRVCVFARRRRRCSGSSGSDDHHTHGHALGLMALSTADAEARRNNDDGEVRRVLVCGQHNLIAAANEEQQQQQQQQLQHANEGEVRMTLDVDGGEVRRDAIVLVVHTASAYAEVDVDVEVYATVPVELAPVREWACVRAVHGSWELGTSAGGARAQCASWVNNPFFGLTTLCQRTRIVVLLLQRPRGAEQPTRRWHKLQRLLTARTGDACGDGCLCGDGGSATLLLHTLRPVLNRDRCTDVQLDLLCYDEELTPLQTAGPQCACEVVLQAELHACRERPYLLVPCTLAAAHDGDFTVLVYADKPVDLFHLEHARLSYA